MKKIKEKHIRKIIRKLLLEKAVGASGELKGVVHGTKGNTGTAATSKGSKDENVDVSSLQTKCSPDKRKKYLETVYSEKAVAKKSAFLNKWGPMFKKMCAGEDLFASVKLAQFILETGWGKHTPGGNSNNYFGIKATGKPGKYWKGDAVNAKTKEEYKVGQKTTITSAFRKYDTLENGLADHTEFLKTNSRYKTALAQKTPEEQAMHIAKAGYATGSCYGESLVQLIKMYGLKKFD